MPIGIAYPVHSGWSFLYLIPNMSYNNVHVHVHVHVLLPYTCTCTTHVNEIEGICVWAFLKNANNYVNNVCLFLAQHNCDGASLGLCWLTARCPAQTPPLQWQPLPTALRATPTDIWQLPQFNTYSTHILASDQSGWCDVMTKGMMTYM